MNNNQILNSSNNNNNSFRRGNSKVFYDSDIWDPGEEARTSFRSSSYEDDIDDDDDSFVASLLRSKTEYVEDFDYDEEMDDPVDYRSYFTTPPVKPILMNSGRPSVLNRSAELDDILEEDREGDGDDENEGSPSPAAISSPSTHSPEGSFRLPRGASVRRSQESNESCSTSSGGEAPVSPPARKASRSTKHTGNGLVSAGRLSSSHKSQDSGFSDSGGSQNGEGSPHALTTNTEKKSAIKVRDMRSQVVHETRSGGGHVSKIYLYTVNDQEDNLTHSDDGSNHVSILDCETGRVRKGYVHRSFSPLLSPPLSPPPPQPQNFSPNTSTDTEVSCELPKLDPLACDIDYYDAFVVTKTKDTTKITPDQIYPSPRPSASTQTIVVSPKSTPSPRIHTGTSSLGRNKKKKTELSNDPTVLLSPNVSFPKTNGSLYESLSLGRPSSRNNANGSHDCNLNKYNTKDAATTPELSPSLPILDSSFGGPSSTASISLPSPAYDGFDDPLSGSRLSFRGSVGDSDGILPTVWHIDGSTDLRLTCNAITSPPNPVQLWLQELGSVYEAECTIMLQSKPVAAGDPTAFKSPPGHPDVGGFWAGSSKDTIRAIQSKAHAISAVFVKLCKQLGHKGVSKLVPLVQGLSHQIHLFLVEYNRCNHLPSNLPGYKPRVTSSNPRTTQSNPGTQVPEEILHQQRLLLQSCDRLKLTVSRHQNNNQNTSDVVDVIRQLGATLTKLIELMLSKEIKLSVESLSRNTPDSNLRGSIDSITALALEGNHLCRLIAKHGGVRLLINICTQGHLRPVRVNAFRALGTVCCVLEGIMELEEAGGIRVLADNLSDTESKEEEKSEAAGLLAQVTSPWIENNSSIEGLSAHLDDLVKSLTNLSDKTRSAETFLLSSAALANLTFMESSVVQLMKTHSTVPVLVAAVLRQQKNVSIYIQDQVAAVLANMAANSECRGEVVRHGGLPILLQFLRSPVPATHSKNKAEWRPEDFAQMAATERVLQKSAIAISRLCNDASLVEEVVRLDGLARLVELCKKESARVGSDGVLVACLAAVRKIASVVGPERFETLDAAELVEPRLLDSFLIFSSKNESFV